MSEEQDESSKTEEPTAKRLEKAREEGSVPISQEVKSLLVLVGAFVTIAAFAPFVMQRMRDTLLPFLAKPHEMPTDFRGLLSLVSHTLASVGLSLLFPVAILILLALTSVVGQAGFLFSPNRLIPDLNKLDIVENAKRMFSLQRLLELVKSLGKFILIGLALYVVLVPRLDWILRLPEMDTRAMLAEVRLAILVLVGTVLGVMLAVSAADYLYARYQNRKKLKMTKQEVKDEHKQMEGDPLARARLRSIRMERVRRRMMQAVPKADVVVTNPTHFAVALSYEMEEMAAPKVVAKGADHVALRIREIAAENGVPIVENPPLARALYATVELDQFIPPEHYRAVAEVIGYVMRLKKKIPDIRPPG